MEVIKLVYLVVIYINSYEMNCLINNIAKYYTEKGRKLEVIRRYLRMKYRINIDSNALKSRIESLQLSEA